jgi:hypothetical protein
VRENCTQGSAGGPSSNGRFYPHNEACPISFSQVNEKAARINGLLTVAVLLAFIFTDFKWIILLLGVDFLIRGFLKPKFSILASISKLVLKLLNVKPQMTNAGPKIFAAKLGFFFCVIVSALYFSGFALPATAIAGIFAFFAFLEGAFGFCVACKVYPMLLALKKQSA